jgi:arsenate reductase
MSTSEPRPRYKVLFLCTGNSARSILAEQFLRRIAPTRFEAYSAGASPRGRVNPLVEELLRDVYHIDPSGSRSKSWEEYRDIPFDFVITVCDRARETCPIWPGQPIVAHWSSEDPDSASNDEEAKRIVRKAALEIYRRIELFTALPLESLDRLRLEESVRSIGKA